MDNLMEVIDENKNIKQEKRKAYRAQQSEANVRRRETDALTKQNARTALSEENKAALREASAHAKQNARTALSEEEKAALREADSLAKQNTRAALSEKKKNTLREQKTYAVAKLLNLMPAEHQSMLLEEQNTQAAVLFVDQNAKAGALTHQIQFGLFAEEGGSRTKPQTLLSKVLYNQRLFLLSTNKLYPSISCLSTFLTMLM